MGAFLVKGALFLFIVLQATVAIPVGNTTDTNSGDTLLKRSKRTPTLIDTLPSFDVIKNGFVNKHNSLRSAVSPSASDMREISWDDELEQLAKDYSANCNFAHSSGLSTSTFSQVGESIHKGLISPTSIADQVTQLWYNEVFDYTYTDNSCAEGKACGHYLQVVWAKSYKIGCGISSCTNLVGNLQGYITVCHYGPNGLSRTIINNVETSDIPYQSGEPCSACDEGLVCRDNSLCYSDATESTTTTTHAPMTTTTTTPIATTTPMATTTTTTTPMAITTTAPMASTTTTTPMASTTTTTPKATTTTTTPMASITTTTPMASTTPMATTTTTTTPMAITTTAPMASTTTTTPMASTTTTTPMASTTTTTPKATTTTTTPMASTTTTTPMASTTTTTPKATTTTTTPTTATTAVGSLNATLISATSTQGSSTNVTTGADQQTSSTEPTTGTAAVPWQQSSAVAMLLVISAGAMFCLQ